MRASILLLFLLLSAATLSAQGTVNFINGNAPVRDQCDNLLGNVCLGQLYASATGRPDGSWVSVGTPAFFRNNAATGLGTGIVVGGVVTIPASIISTPGGGVWLQLRAWTAYSGATWEAALASGVPHTAVGESAPFQVAVTGNPTSVPPGVPASITGLTSFHMWGCPVLPEPLSFPLLALGLGLACVLRSRRCAPSPDRH